MPFIPAKKATLLIPSGSDRNPDSLHLHVMLTNACKDNQHLLVSLATARDGQFYDTACVIELGEHPFIARQSCVVYRRLRTSHRLHLIKCVDGGLFVEREPVSDDLYERICAGIDASQFAPQGMRAYWTKNKLR